MADWAVWAAGAGELRFGGLDTPDPKPASTLFMAVACLGWGAVTLVLGEEGKASHEAPGLSGNVQGEINHRAALLGNKQLS